MLLAAALLVFFLGAPTLAHAKAGLDSTDSSAPNASALDASANPETPAASDAPAPEFTELSELSGKRFGNLTGSVFDAMIDEHIADHGEILSFSTPSDLAAALTSGKIDAYVLDEPVSVLCIARNSGIALMPTTLEDTDYGFFFPKGSPLTREFNSVLERFWEDGTIDTLREKWVVSADDAAKVIAAQDWDAPNGTLTMATAPVYEPMSYMGPNNQIVGYDLELAYLVCKELGYRLVPTSYTIDGIISAVESGKADFGGTGTTITEERKQKVDFSTPIYKGAVVVSVRDVNATNTGSGFLDGLSESFRRTFVVEDRWRMVLAGLGVTVLISVAAAVLGCALGFLLTFARRTSSRVDKVVGGFQTLMGGLPIVVVLMILYYIVFGAIDIPGVLVAIIGFALSFGAAASANIWNAVQAIDAGQNEAALALGYSKQESFRKVVLPQAAQQFIPLLLGQMVSLVKETSIVGYIAVQDLTRASDLIRARTLEAFFPLIATAIIYFAICWLLLKVGRRVVERWDPEKRPRTLEGVKP